MHEAGIMDAALDAIRAQAERHQATRVLRVVLRVGALSGADPAALRFAFEALAPGGIAAGALLEIESVPARAHCAACDRDFAASPGFILCCPDCGAGSGDLRAGRELAIALLEFPPLA